MKFLCLTTLLISPFAILLTRSQQVFVTLSFQWCLEHNQGNTVHVHTHTHTHSLLHLSKYTLYFILYLASFHSCFVFYCIYTYCNLFNWFPFDGHLVSNFLLEWITLYIHFVHYQAFCKTNSQNFKLLDQRVYVYIYNLIYIAIFRPLELSQFTPYKLHMKVYFSMASSTQWVIKILNFCWFDGWKMVFKCNLNSHFSNMSGIEHLFT